MSQYVVPPDIREKEKIIGGILNIYQMFWAIGGIVLGGSLFAIIYLVTKVAILAGIIGIIGIALALPFIFYKKNDLTLYQIIFFNYKFKNKTKHLPNKRREL